MNELLTAVKKALTGAVPGIRDVFIALDEQVMPAGTKLPAYGIKDGKVTTIDGSCNTKTDTLQLTVVSWAPNGKNDAPVMGDSTQIGVLEMTKAAAAILDSNLLAIDGMQEADAVNSAASRYFVNKQRKSIQQKTLLMEYVRER